MQSRQVLIQLSVLLAVCAALAVPPRIALAEVIPTNLIYYLWPDYCKAKMTELYSNPQFSWKWKPPVPLSRKELEGWERRVGPDWKHLHHYCWALGSITSHAPMNKNIMGDIIYSQGKSNPGSPLWIDFTLTFASGLEQTGERARAIQELTELAQLHPDDPNVLTALANTLERAGRTQDAIGLLEQALTRNVKKGPLLFYLARYYYALGDVARATKLAAEAEQAGMKMDALRRQMAGDSGRAKPPATGAAAARAGGPAGATDPNAPTAPSVLTAPAALPMPGAPVAVPAATIPAAPTR